MLPGGFYNYIQHGCHSTVVHILILQFLKACEKIVWISKIYSYELNHDVISSGKCQDKVLS